MGRNKYKSFYETKQSFSIDKQVTNNGGLPIGSQSATETIFREKTTKNRGRLAAMGVLTEKNVSGGHRSQHF